jgi:hypothetical protein
MLFSLLVNPLTGKDLDWADPSKHPSVPALGRAVINKCFTEVCTPESDYQARAYAMPPHAHPSSVRTSNQRVPKNPQAAGTF